MAYFPAISLSFKESVAFNFGSRPLRYPLGVGRGGLKGEELVLRSHLEAVGYAYLTAIHFLLLALVCRAGSRREETGYSSAAGHTNISAGPQQFLKRDLLSALNQQLQAARSQVLRPF